jgi:hypothetical protein
MHKAKLKGTPITRREKKCKVGGFTLYMRPATRAIIVKAADVAKMNVNRFVLLEVLRGIAYEKGKPLESLLPEDEYQALVFNKYPKKRKPQK